MFISGGKCTQDPGKAPLNHNFSKKNMVMRRKRKAAYRRRFVPPRQRIQPAQRGYVRRAGYYGRYSRASDGERKFVDTDLDAVFTTITAAMESANVNIIVQGNTESQRIGRKVVLKRIDCKGLMTLPAATDASNTSEVVRILLVCDKQTNGAAFVGTDLWETDSWRSFNNLANSSRFKVLKSVTYTFNASAGSGRGSTDTLSYGEVARPWKMGVDLNIPIEFDNSATTGVVTSQRTNSLWVVTQSTTGSVVMSVSTARIRFVDG